MLSAIASRYRISLYGAARVGNLDAIAYHIDHGADLNVSDSEGNRPLILAAFHGHSRAVKLLLRFDANVNITDERGVSALMWAAARGAHDVMRCLIHYGASLDQIDNSGETALIWAARNSQAESIGLLIAMGANVNIRLRGGVNALMWPAMNGDLGIIQQLIAAKIELDARSESEYRAATPLLMALKGGHEAAAKLLLAAGARKDVCDNAGKSALLYAERRGFADIVSEIKAAGISLLSIHQAVAEGNLAIVKHHVKNGIDLEVYDAESMSALMLAVKAGHEAIVRYLLNHGAYTGAAFDCAVLANNAAMTTLLLSMKPEHYTESDLQQALEEAVEQGFPAIVQALINHGVKVNSMDYEPVFNRAVLKGNIDIVNMLLAAGADVNRPDYMGYTSPLKMAVIGGSQEVVELLIAKGAYISRQEIWAAAEYGRTAIVATLLRFDDSAHYPYAPLSIADRLETPFLIAARAGKVEVVKLMLDYGVNVNARTAAGATALMLAGSPAYFAINSQGIKHAVAHTGSREIMKVLLAQGADSYEVDNTGKTAIDYACHAELKAWLIHQSAWLRRRHTVCFYARRHQLAETGIIASL